MKFSFEQIKEAKEKLANPEKLSFKERLWLHFIATGSRLEESPNVDDCSSNYSFFHIKEIPCELRIKGSEETINGIFSHEDYSPFYIVKTAEKTYYFKGGTNINGCIKWGNYLPIDLALTVGSVYEKYLLEAGYSLDCSNL